MPRMELIEKLSRGEAVVAVVGLGYVGLPLALGFARSGLKTLGLDIDPAKVEALNDGRSYIKHIPRERVAGVRDSGTLEATTDFSRVTEADAIIICVPTPLTRHREPDLSYVISTIESILPHLRPGQLVSLESTTYPGTTEEELKPRLEKAGLTVGVDVHLVFSPEREDPGNPDYTSATIPKVIGGVTPACLEAGIALYSRVCERMVPVSSPRIAEFTKLLENIHRAVNIGLVNELKMVADRMGIDIWEAIEAAKTKPFGFTPFYPGPGLGGHCIPIDPFYLTWKAKEFDLHTRFIEMAGEINTSMPTYVVAKVAEALNRRHKPLNGSRILILGLAYKPNVDDLRESPSFRLMDLLADQGAGVDYCDPHIPEIPVTREHLNWKGLRSVPWEEATLRGYDCVVISTAHAAFSFEELAAWADLIVDTRNAMAALSTEPGQVVKA